MRLAVTVPAPEAVRVTGVTADTAPVVMLNVADAEPCATVTEAEGAATAALELESLTITPPAPAGPDSVTVPDPLCPLVRLLGVTLRLARVGDAGFTVIPNDSFTPRYEAESITDVVTVTGASEAVNEPDVAPCGMTSVAGTPV